MQRAIVVMAKAPREGTVKTRLHSSLGAARSTELYVAMLRDTFALAEMAGSVRLSTRLVLCYAPAADLAVFEGIVPRGFDAIGQRGDDLGDRLVACFDDVGRSTSNSVVVIGADSPTLPPHRIVEAIDSLEGGADIVFGPTRDGGYYLVAARRPPQAVFRDIPWSTPGVYDASCERARELGLAVHSLEPWYDVDEEGDLERLRSDAAVGAFTRRFFESER